MGLNIRLTGIVLETLPETVVLFGLTFLAGGKTRYVVTPYFFWLSWALTEKNVVKEQHLFV